MLSASVTPLASILGSGLLIIVPVLERSLGGLAVLGAAGISVVAWLVGTAIRHNVVEVEGREERGELDRTTAGLGRGADAVIVVAYVISVALYLRIMAEYVVGVTPLDSSQLAERLVAMAAVVVIVVVGITRGFDGLDLLDRVALATVLVLTTVLGGALVLSDAGHLLDGTLSAPPVPNGEPLSTLAVLGGIVITVQGFETVRYLGDSFDAVTRVRASRVAQLVAASIYIGFVATATPAMGLGTPDGADDTLLDITARIAPFLAIPLVLSAVLSQFSAAVADTAAADGNLRGLLGWFRGPRPFLVSGLAAILLAATVPTYTIVAVASRAFAAYYAVECVIAVRTSQGRGRQVGFGTLAVLMVAITLFGAPAG